MGKTKAATPAIPKYSSGGGEVGMRGYLDHVFGTVMLIERRDDGYWYLLDEHPHDIGTDSKWFWHPRNPYTEGEPGPGMMRLCWWPEKKLKRRKTGKVCSCRFCLRYRKPQKK